MKKEILLTIKAILIILLFSNEAYTQFSIVKDNLDHPTAVTFYQEKAYASIAGRQPHTGKIISFDLDDPEGTYEVLFDSLSSYPRCITIHNAILYIGFNGYIGKVDLAQSSLSLVAFSTDVISPRSLMIKNDKLYIAENSIISYIDLNSQNSNPTTLVNDIAPRPLSIAFKNDDLYFVSGGDIKKVDLTDSDLEVQDVYLGLEKNIYAISILGNEIYIDQTYPGFGSIMKLDLTDHVKILKSAMNDVYNVIHITHRDGIMYFVGARSPSSILGKIYRFDYGIVTGVKNENTESYTVYPNPTNSFIRIKGELNQDSSMSLRDQTGRLVRRNTGTSEMDMRELQNGIYYLEIRNDKTQDFSRHKIVKVD